LPRKVRVWGGEDGKENMVGCIIEPVVCRVRGKRVTSEGWKNEG